MERLTDTDMSNASFPYRAVKEIAIGFARVTCARITYVGELGYELHIPVEHALHVYERVLEVGEPLGMVHAGLKALASLRMEKAYRDYGHDMDNTDTLLEVGLGFTADYEKAGGFIGKEAIVKQRDIQKAAKGALKKRLLQVLCLNPEPLMYHGEVIWRNGVRVGDVRAASYGHTLGWYMTQYVQLTLLYVQ
jgi:glycine cleavage system aminomethyltransferase T